MPTHAQAVQAAKRKAIAFLEMGDLRNAVASFVADMGQRDDTRLELPAYRAAITDANARKADRVRAWIEGFAE